MEISILAIHLRTPENLGMLFRVADAFGVKKVFINPTNIEPTNKIVKRIARDTVDKIEWEIITNEIALLQQLKANNTRIIALETAQNAKRLFDFQLDASQNYLIVIGAERFGIEDEILMECDETIAIPMFGENSSMNVACSLSVCLYEIQKQKSKK